jgi:alkanesulfonate monooxygenase SsuD/methylene tetrahydromethanopterin reductase-like flavin-dependent oxidoreductase (luciferase family)
VLTASQPAEHARPGTGGAGSVGFVVPTYPQHRSQPPATSELAEACRRAEAAGAGALWACDHLYWHTPALECLSTVALSALSTSRVAVGSCVLQLPLRSVHAVAKQAAALSEISGGRLVLGVGMGARRGEYEAAGVDFDTRATRLDGAIEELRQIWSGAGDGDYRQLPLPRPAPPIWVGGSSEASLRRAARLGDGWVPLFLSPSEYSSSMERLDKETERAGRDPAGVHRAIVVFVSVGGERAREEGLEWMSSLYSLPPDLFERHLVSGSAATAADSLGRYFDAGASHVAVFVTADDPVARFEDLLGELDTARLVRA